MPEGKPRILVVDDDSRNRKLLHALLTADGYETAEAENGAVALRKIAETGCDVVLLDVMMPEIDGFEVARRLKSDPETSRIPIVMVTALNDVQDRVKALEAGADDFLSKPVDKTELRARIQTLVKVKAYYDHLRNYEYELEKEVGVKTRELRVASEKIKAASLETIFRLAAAAEYRDEDTGAHIIRISRYAGIIALNMGLEKSTAEMLETAAPMHDIGKIGIPDNILLKPGKLTSTEWEIMKRHTTIGARILKNSEAAVIRSGETIALTHHEKWDGSGYPDGLKKDAIPIEGRIVAIVDVFDALTSRRPYKEPVAIGKAFEIIRESAGTHFDPKVVVAFFASSENITKIRDEYGIKS